MALLDHLDNPVLRRELLNALRSNKAFVLLFIYVIALIGVMWLAWPPEKAEMSLQAERTGILFQVFAQGQLVMIAMLAPAFSASCLTIEKERRCIDLLLTSPIHPRTILMGKYFSSVTYLVLLVVATAPLVSACLFLPGLEPHEITGLYVLLFSVACCFGMIGLTASVHLARTQAALSVTYLIVLPLTVMLLVVSMASKQFFHISISLWPSIFFMVATVFMYAACQARMVKPFDPVQKSADEEDISTQTGLVLVRDRFPDNLLAPARGNELLEDNINPVLAKEMRCEVFGRGTLFLRLIIQISMFLSVIFLTFLYMEYEYIFVHYLIVFSMLVAPAFACNTFTQERERGTLDLLMTTLISPAQIVWGKLIASYRLSMILTGLVGVTLLFYLLVPGKAIGWDEKVFYFFVYVFLVALTVFYETVLAMFVSLVCGSTLASMVTTYVFILLLFVAPVAAEKMLNAFANIKPAEIAWFTVTSPFAAIYSVAPHGEKSLRDVPPIWLAYCAIAIAVTSALLFIMLRWFEYLITRCRVAR